MLMVIYSSGLRVSESVKLKPENIIRDRMLLKICGAKGHKDRYTILSHEALKHLEKYWKLYRPKEWLFPGKSGKSAMAVRSCQHAFYKAKENAGITKKGGIHTLRHSFATHALETGCGIFQVQKFLGHKALRTTLQYVHLQEENILARSPLDVILEQQDKDHC